MAAWTEMFSVMIFTRFLRRRLCQRSTQCAAAVLCRLVWGIVLTALLLHPAVPVLAHIGEPAIRLADDDGIASQSADRSEASLDWSDKSSDADQSTVTLPHPEATSLDPVLSQRSGERDLTTDRRVARCLHPLSLVRPLQWPGRANLAARAPHHVPASGSPSLVTLGMRLQP